MHLYFSHLYRSLPISLAWIDNWLGVGIACLKKKVWNSKQHIESQLTEFLIFMSWQKVIFENSEPLWRTWSRSITIGPTDWAWCDNHYIIVVAIVHTVHDDICLRTMFAWWRAVHRCVRNAGNRVEATTTGPSISCRRRRPLIRIRRWIRFLLCGLWLATYEKSKSINHIEWGGENAKLPPLNCCLIEFKSMTCKNVEPIFSSMCLSLITSCTWNRRFFSYASPSHTFGAKRPYLSSMASHSDWKAADKMPRALGLFRHATNSRVNVGKCFSFFLVPSSKW